MADGGYTHYIGYYVEDDEYTNHLVRETDEMYATTACGRELKRAENRQFTRPPMGWVSPIPDDGLPDLNKCGNCPWEEVDA